MGTESYFRIKDSRKMGKTQQDIHDLLRRIAMIIQAGGSIHCKTSLIAPENSSQDDKTITGYGQIYESNSGYKYKVGSSNDWRIDNVDLCENMFLISYRYGYSEQMQDITKGICRILDCDYMYNLELENRIIKEIHPLLVKEKIHSMNYEDLNYDEIFEESRYFISLFMKKNKLTEDELKDSNVIDTLIHDFKLKIQS